MGWLFAALMRIATGSATVAMTTASGIVAPVAIGLGYPPPELLVLATGASALTPPLPAAALEISQPINDLADYRQFLGRCAGKQQICILGAGLVGIE